MKKETKENQFLKRPYYEGGQKALNAFIKQHLSYPKSALNNKIEGTVYIDYSIDYQGNVVETKVISKLGHGCDEEAERVVRLLKFKVEKTRKLKVLFHKKIQIHFRLPKPKTTPKEPTTSYHYNYVPSSQKKKASSEKSSTSKSYHYKVYLK